ncbi:MAG: twin-arginine translocase subunit TatB [Anaerolineales bacterium]|nr:twin-arginine translocase subunit TatB [Anaerolineales bacterium]
MDILGIGFPELLFIFIIALMVFGPRRLPEIAGKAGRFVRDLRNMSQGFLAEWQREITVAARLEELEEVRKELNETKQVLQQSKTEVSSSAAQIGQTVNSVARSSATSTPKVAETNTIAPPTPSPEIAPTEAPSAPQPETEAPSTSVDAPTPPVETVAEPVEVEKNGVGSKPVPAPVAPTEVAE